LIATNEAGPRKPDNKLSSNNKWQATAATAAAPAAAATMKVFHFLKFDKKKLVGKSTVERIRLFRDSVRV